MDNNDKMVLLMTNLLEEMANNSRLILKKHSCFSISSVS